MHPAAFGQQQRIGEELLAAGWYARAIASASRPGSAWVLSDPLRQLRVRMSVDLSAPMADVAAVRPSDCQFGGPVWHVRIHHADASSIVDALLAGPDADVADTGRARRHMLLGLKGAGMLPDRGRLAAALSGVRIWRSPDRAAEVTWSAPGRAQEGGWQIQTASVHADASSATPAAVLLPLIGRRMKPGSEAEA